MRTILLEKCPEGKISYENLFLYLVDGSMVEVGVERISIINKKGNILIQKDVWDNIDLYHNLYGDLWLAMEFINDNRRIKTAHKFVKNWINKRLKNCQTPIVTTPPSFYINF